MKKGFTSDITWKQATLDTSKAKHKSVFSKNKKQPVYKLLITSRESREFAKTIKVSKPKKIYSIKTTL